MADSVELAQKVAESGAFQNLSSPLQTALFLGAMALLPAALVSVGVMVGNEKNCGGHTTPFAPVAPDAPVAEPSWERRSVTSYGMGQEWHTTQSHLARADRSVPPRCG